MYLSSVHIKGIFICTVNCKDVHGTRKQMAPVIPNWGEGGRKGDSRASAACNRGGNEKKGV